MPRGKLKNNKGRKNQSLVYSQEKKEDRLAWVLRRLPSEKDLNKKDDIDESLSKEWQLKINKKLFKALPGLKVADLAKKAREKAFFESAGDFAYRAFSSNIWIKEKIPRDRPLMKRSVDLRKIEFASVGRFLAAAAFVLVFSFLAVLFLPKTVDRYLAIIDSTLKKPIAAINNALIPKNMAIMPAKTGKSIIINKKDLSDYIVKNQNYLKTAEKQGINSIPVPENDIKGRVAGAEDNGQSCLYEKAKNFVNTR